MVSQLSRFFILFLHLSWFNFYLTEKTEWDYEAYGSDIWPDIIPQCGGQSQSPIDIKTTCSVYKSFETFNLSDSYATSQEFSVRNSGHSIFVNQINSQQFPLWLSGGGLNGVYRFVNFHVHWGENYGTGSEHQVNGKKYSGEVHFVHTNTNGSDYAAFGFFINAIKRNQNNLTASRTRRRRDTRENLNWMYFLETAAKLKELNQTTKMNLTIKTFMGTDLNSFWRYQGSFTTPNCDEIVTWTVFNKEIELDDDLFENLRESIKPKNYRNPQRINNRTIYRSYRSEKMILGSDSQCCMSSNAIKFIPINIFYFIAFVLMF